MLISNIYNPRFYTGYKCTLRSIMVMLEHFDREQDDLLLKRSTNTNRPSNSLSPGITLLERIDEKEENDELICETDRNKSSDSSLCEVEMKESLEEKDEGYSSKTPSPVFDDQDSSLNSLEPCSPPPLSMTQSYPSPLKVEYEKEQKQHQQALTWNFFLMIDAPELPKNFLWVGEDQPFVQMLVNFAMRIRSQILKDGSYNHYLISKSSLSPYSRQYSKEPIKSWEKLGEFPIEKMNPTFFIAPSAVWTISQTILGYRFRKVYAQPTTDSEVEERAEAYEEEADADDEEYDTDEEEVETHEEEFEENDKEEIDELTTESAEEEEKNSFILLNSEDLMTLASLSPNKLV